MTEKKEKFFKEILAHGSAVLVGPLLKNEEIKFIKNSPLIIVDGGFEKCLEHSLLGERSYYSVGDGDSTKAQLDELLPSKKDFSDLQFALDLLPNSITNIELFGFLGGRKDHEICNFGEVHNFLLKKNDQSQVNFSNEVLFLSSGNWFLSHIGEFSLVGIERPKVKVTGEIDYQLNSLTELSPLSSLGLSNNSRGEFCLETTGPVMLYGAGIKVKAE